MSKVDAQRAMREAKYARNKANGVPRREASRPAAVAPAAKVSTPQVSAPSTKQARVTEAPAAARSGELCGHKSMNGRACTRGAGHSEKSHRYG